MACTRLTGDDIRQPKLTDHDTSETPVRLKVTESLFQQLPGMWTLNRRLQSTNATEPAGNCTGTATFTPREPSVFINKDGKLEMASAELVYHEQGHFEMQSTSAEASSVRFPFSRKYVWRFQRQAGDQSSTFSIWFTKPGTESIDYLFHKVHVTIPESDENRAEPASICLQGDACHLCEDDLYSSSYTFTCGTENELSDEPADHVKLASWTMLHEVRGPQKDQVIETTFTRQ